MASAGRPVRRRRREKRRLEASGTTARNRAAGGTPALRDDGSQITKFLIANGILESGLTCRKQRRATLSNREQKRHLCICNHAWGMTFKREAKKRLIATHANSKIHATHSKRTRIAISNRNKNRCFGIQGVSSVGPGFVRHRDKDCRTRSGAALRRGGERSFGSLNRPGRKRRDCVPCPPEGGRYIGKFVRHGNQGCRTKPGAALLGTLPRAGIGEALSGFGDEFPIVGGRVQRELEDAESVGVAGFAGAQRNDERAMISSAGADDEFADAVRGVGLAVGVLRSEALVVVIVAGEDERGVRGVQIVPERFRVGIPSIRAARAEERLVPVGQRASGGMRLQILLQPFFLWRADAAAAGGLALAVEHHDVPRAQVVAVRAGLGIARGGAEIIEVGRRAAGMEIMIAGGRARARFVTAPCGPVAILEFLRGAVGIDVVANGEHRAGNFVEEFCSGFCAGKIGAVGDVARADEHRIARARGRRLRRGRPRETLARLGASGRSGFLLREATRARSRKNRSADERREKESFHRTLLEIKPYHELQSSRQASAGLRPAPCGTGLRSGRHEAAPPTP
jgi:hypothetical protein